MLYEEPHMGGMGDILAALQVRKGSLSPFVAEPKGNQWEGEQMLMKEFLYKKKCFSKRALQETKLAKN